MATEHSTITNANCHEPKHITSATTADSGKVITSSSSSNGVSEYRKLATSDLTDVGWGKWADDTYDSVSPLTITASTRTQMTIDGAGAQTETSQIPAGSTNWWDTATNKIVPDDDFDAYLVRINFSAEAAAGSPYFEIELDIGGSINTIISETRTLIKGTGVENKFMFVWPVYTGTTFEANGGTVYITPNVDTDFYDFEIQIHKLSSGV